MNQDVGEKGKKKKEKRKRRNKKYTETMHGA